METNDKPSRGIHHITAIASSASDNLRFYTEVLGLRLVKKTVNFDDPGTYHLYYGNGVGAPGTILTFFPWEDLPRGRAGAGMVTAVAFAIPRRAVPFWSERLARFGIPAAEEPRFGTPVLRFTDPHGLALELAGVEDEPDADPWGTAGIPVSAAIRGFHSATATVNDAAPTRHMLTALMGMRPTASENGRTRFAMAGPSDPGIFYDLVEDRTAAPGRQGGGTVHHIAFRADDAKDQERWRGRVVDFGVDVTPVIDRHYFRSIYFRETGGVLFEIATDPPGFTVDESVETLGSALKLPPQYESRRAAIERGLPPLGGDANRGQENVGDPCPMETCGTPG